MSQKTASLSTQVPTASQTKKEFWLPYTKPLLTLDEQVVYPSYFIFSKV